jgi:hypothetical protein
VKDRNRNILFFVLGAITALFVVESRKEKPFEGLKNRAKKLKNLFKTEN